MNGSKRFRVALIYDRSLRSRHELGYIASLKLHGVNTLVVLLDEAVSKPLFCEENIEVNGNMVKVPILKLPEAKAHTYYNLLDELIVDFHVEFIITMPRKPYLLTYRLSKKFKTPFIVRFWSIRAFKLFDNLRSGAYGDLFLFIPSLVTNVAECLLSNGVMVVDDVMYRALKRIHINRGRILIKVYPPAGFLPRGKLDEDVVEKIRGAEPYIAAITVLGKTGPYLKFEARPHALLFYRLAKRIPSINFLIGGSTKEEFVATFPNLRDKIPRNLIFLGRGFTDDTLKFFYKHALAVVNYINNRNISNRLLEAMALNKIVVTNYLALQIHPELRESVIIAHSLKDYEKAIIGIIRGVEENEKLQRRLLETYLKYFSPKLNYTLTLEMMNLLKNTVL